MGSLFGDEMPSPRTPAGRTSVQSSVATSAASGNIVFDAVDATVFRISDTRTKLDALQQYFFPRLERLLELQLDKVRKVYGHEPLEAMTYVYRPSHRKSAKSVLDTSEVYVGLSGRSTGAPLKVFNRKGEPYRYSVSSLCLAVHPQGAIRVSLRPYLYYVNEAFKDRLIGELQRVWDDLSAVLEWSRMRPGPGSAIWLPMSDSLVEEFPRWESQPVHFPASTANWLRQLGLPFLVGYAVLDTAVRIARGEDSRLPDLLEAIWERGDDDVQDADFGSGLRDGEELNESAGAGLDEEVRIDDYTLVRPGRRWQVFARDSFACCACGRSTKQHGITLHVDHIVPRSKGGTDELSNLQALCAKCNLGKSNKSNERLTAK